MSEEETLIDDNPVEEAAAEEVVESTEVEAAAPEEGEKPEWLKDKYKSVEDQAKAYAELEKKFGGFTGSPEGDYEMKVPEGISGEFDMDDPRIASSLAVLHCSFAKMHLLSEFLSLESL